MSSTGPDYDALGGAILPSPLASNVAADAGLPGLKCAGDAEAKGILLAILSEVLPGKFLSPSMLLCWPIS